MTNLLSTADVAERLGITPRAVRDAAQRGSLEIDESEGIGNRATYFFAADEVERYRKVHLGKPGKRKGERRPVAP